VDWYVALGNHDYDGNPQAQVDYSQISRRWRLPARYYAFREKVADGVDAEFFVLDTSPFITESGGEPQAHDVPHTDTTAQRKWLDSALTASTAKWKFIVGHHPVYGHRLYPVIRRWSGCSCRGSRSTASPRTSPATNIDSSTLCPPVP